MQPSYSMKVSLQVNELHLVVEVVVNDLLAIQGLKNRTLVKFNFVVASESHEGPLYLFDDLQIADQLMVY